MRTTSKILPILAFASVLITMMGAFLMLLFSGYGLFLAYVLAWSPGLVLLGFICTVGLFVMMMPYLFRTLRSASTDLLMILISVCVVICPGMYWQAYH